MPRPTLEFELPDRLDEGAALARVAELLDVELGRTQTTERVLLDTFDARLRAAGLRAEWAAPRRGAHRQLTLHEPGMPIRCGDVPDGPAVTVAVLPPGPLHDRLAPVLERRALLPLARVRSRTVPVAVRNGDQKTVVRLVLEQCSVGQVTLGLRLAVQPVRGYDRDFDRTVDRLRDGLSLADAEPRFDAAVTAAGGRPEGTSSKVLVALDRGTRADVAAGAVLLPLADIAAANVGGVLDDLDAEFLHDLRVSIRRARSVLRELAGVHAPAIRARLRAELTWAQALTGPVRDLDVQLGDWDELSGSRQEQLEPLRRLLERRRSRELAKLRRGLRSRRFTALLDAWRALAAQPAGPPTAAGDGDDRPRAALPIEVVAADRIHRVYRRMVRDGRRIDADSPDEDLHELRKRGKELRYLLELFGSLYPAGVVQPMVGALKELQDVLGRFQDRSVQAELLRNAADELAALPDGPRAVLGAGLVISDLEADSRRARQAFAKRFDTFASKEQRARVRATFGEVEPV